MKNPKNSPAPPGKFALTASAAIDFTAAGEGGEAKRPTFSINAYNGGAMKLNGLYRPIVIDLAGLTVAKLPILFGHDHGAIVGQADTVKVGKSSINLSGMVTGDHELPGTPAHTVVSHARNGFDWQASVGFMVDSLERVDEGQVASANGQKFNGPVYISRATRLYEVSFVAVGADGSTSTKVAARAAEENTDMDFTKWLEARGLAESDLTEKAIETLKAAYTAEQKPADPPAKAEPPAPPVDEVAAKIAKDRERFAAEAARVDAIAKVCGTSHADIQAKAITEGWAPEKAELEVLRASRGKAPAGHVGDGAAPTATVLEAAACMQLRLSNTEKQYDEKTLDAAGKTFRAGIGLQEMLLIAAASAGHTFRTFRGNERAVLEAAFSNRSIAGILSNVANKIALDSFNYVEQTWRRITRTRPVSDFKTITSYRLTGEGEYKAVAPDGEIKHGTLGEESYTNQATTYGKMLALTRQDIINDDLGMLNQIVGKMGGDGARTLNKVFWTKFLDNAAVFTTGRKNYFSGAGTVLSASSLGTAEQMFMDQTDADGNPISVMPVTLLVPTALAGMARTLFDSQELRDTTASTKYGTANIYRGRFEPLVSAYLGNSAYSGYSATAWHLCADPAVLPVMEVVFLNGRQEPTIESSDADFDNLGIKFRGVFDFGVNFAEYRGCVKSKGAA